VKGFFKKFFARRMCCEPTACGSSCCN
jgi:hypothetical protein